MAALCSAMLARETHCISGTLVDEHEYISSTKAQSEAFLTRGHDGGRGGGNKMVR